ncbi:SpoIIE family protein phosphatase [Pontiella agarivorans]|uniref:SpoIIE family protein phosphatase n=1 Tax=Pontiella agarivorans TaxID=3038953 RepID=A0ABU5MV83_9BACT|nr:SpoIIE family protein phosphatase [Pontiella agarivorans]MDZ8118090.1 SpoIIE family protein phosphatase [Pontiella agarivorans]
MEHMTDNIYFKDRESRFIMVNKSFCDWTGLSNEAVIGKTDFDLFASAHAQQAYDDEQRIIATGEPIIGIEEKETWEDGRITWVSSTKMPLKSAEGEIIGTFGISRDITEHKEAELRAAYYAEQIRRIKEEMEEDVRMAAELQKTFFPRTYPVYPPGAAPGHRRFEFLHHYNASGGVSGDFCTIQELSDSKVGIFLCDVMGHGVRAALVTALICALVEETAPVESDPGRFLSRMNSLLLPILRQEDIFLYATACYMVLDMETGLLQFANAGHPVPFHFQALEKRAVWLMDDPAQRGPALAIAEGMQFQTLERQVAEEDRVVMYTDGLYEVIGDDGEELGEERLLAAASRQAGKDLPDLFSGLLEEVRCFAADGKFDDDICLAGFRRRAL